MSTCHANTARDALVRLENMVGMAGLQVVQKSLRQQIASAISIVVQASRLSDGKRKIMSISEVIGMEGDVITMQDIFTFKQTGVGMDGAVVGKMAPTGIRPRIADKLSAHGVNLPDKIFEPWFEAMDYLIYIAFGLGGVVFSILGWLGVRWWIINHGPRSNLLKERIQILSEKNQVVITTDPISKKHYLVKTQ